MPTLLENTIRVTQVDPIPPHHIQWSGGCGGEALGEGDGGGRGRAGRAWTGG